jgi:uncharacterized membrane protein YfcA
MMPTVELDIAAMGLLLLAAFAAGLIDAVAGGGGLITMPAMLLMLPGAPMAGILATTKCASLAGTAGAAASYAKRVELPAAILIPSVAAALPSSWLGARAVSHLDPSLVKPAILAVLIAVAAYTWLKPDLGAARTRGMPLSWQPFGAACLGAVMGFYDGFLGPGTGSILMLLLIALFGRDFLQASALAKFVNVASNAGALLWFVPAGSVLWRLALPMAACNLVGGLIGSRLAVWSGNAWIRRVFLAVVAALIARLAWNLYGPDFPG